MRELYRWETLLKVNDNYKRGSQGDCENRIALIIMNKIVIWQKRHSFDKFSFLHI